MRYYFVRHGIAEDMAADDFSRQLTARGRRRVATSASVMKRLNLQPARIFSSPRLRARQTAEIIADTLGLPVNLADEVNFGFDLSDINYLTRDSRIDDEVMFVGHNPDMSDLVHQLTGVDVSMKKGGLARVDLLGKQARHGELVWLIAPKVFDTLSKSKGKTVDSEALSLTPPSKLPQTDPSVHKLIQHRWSPVGFDRQRGIEHRTLRSILEAARWTASSANLQPWRFIVAPRENGEEFERVLSVLVEGNQTWAQYAAVLMIAVAQTVPKPDFHHRHAPYDLGQAVAQMVMQALHHGIYAHQMAGFFPEKARELYRIPDEFEPYTAIALGYRSEQIDHLSDKHQQREAARRERKPLSETVFSGAWEQSAEFLE